MQTGSEHRSHPQLRAAAAATALLGVLVATAATSASGASGSGNVHAAISGTPTTFLISRSFDGGTPNGPSTHGVISNDKRYARGIAFQSEASNIVRGDTNGVSDVFVVRRASPVDNEGIPWRIGKTSLISRTGTRAPANGPSYAPSIDGAFHETPPKCVGFISEASNIGRGDTNGVADAFVAKIKGRARPRRLLPGGHQSTLPTTAIAVSGNCRSIAFITGGKLYASVNGKKPRRIATRGVAADPSYSTGLRNDLVFGAAGGVYLAKDSRHPRLVGRGGRNPAYNDIKRQVVAYEKRIGGHMQIAYHDIGRPEHVISKSPRGRGDGDSLNPVIGNSGYYVSFQSHASNLQTSAFGGPDANGAPDTYLYTDTRKITLAESLTDDNHLLPAGGENPSMAFYANYIVFDTPRSLDSGTGPRQVFMRYVGGK
jgi:hypothetical protein